jgi:hypothetical protein
MARFTRAGCGIQKVKFRTHCALLERVRTSKCTPGSCKEISKDKAGVERAVWCISCDPLKLCERLSSSLFRNAGPVHGKELLARFVTSPPSVKRPLPGELNDTEFQQVYTLGLSVQRVRGRWAVSAKEVHRRGQRHAETKRRQERGTGKAPERLYLGCFHFIAGELRSLCLDKEVVSRIRVYDTAERTNREHAEVFADLRGIDAKVAKMTRQQIRTRLYMLAHQRGLRKSPFLADDDPHLKALGVSLHGA